MQIHGPAHIHGPQSISAPHRTQPMQQPAPGNTAAGVDHLDISREADLISRVREVPDTRAERIEQIRQAIQAGQYETEDKLNTALDRLLEEIGS